MPPKGDPVLIIPTGDLNVTVQTTPWIEDVRTWLAPQPEDDGVSMVVEAVQECGSKHGRVGAELGPESRLTMPVGDFLRVKEALSPAEMVDGDWLLRRMRMVKSAAEIALIRFVCQAVSQAFEDLPNKLRAGDTERVAARKFQADVLHNGGEKIIYLICTSGPNGYPSISMGPTDRVLGKGDVLIIDTGVSYEGYYCDFDREFSFGPPSDQIKLAYDAAWRATEAGIKAARPGNRTQDIWRAQAEVIAEFDDKPVSREGFGAGRMGHGLGLRMCEPPSNGPDDPTVLEENMVLTIEPGLPFTVEGPDGPESRILVHEENVVVTPAGGEVLTRRAPREMSVVD